MGQVSSCCVLLSCSRAPRTTGGSVLLILATAITSVMSTATATPTTTTRPTRMAWPSDSAARKGRSDKVTGNGEISTSAEGELIPGESQNNPSIRSAGRCLHGGRARDNPFHGWNRYADRTRALQQFCTADAQQGRRNYDERRKTRGSIPAAL